MEISKEKDLYVFRKKAEEVMKNTEKIFEKIKEQGKNYEKSEIGDMVSFKMENGLYVDITPEMIYIGNEPISKSHSEVNPTGVYLIAINNDGSHSVRLTGVEKNRIIFTAEITRKKDGDWMIDNDAMSTYLDSEDWSLFDVAQRYIEKNDNEANLESNIGNLVLKKERIKRLNQFKDMVGLEDLKKSGNTRQWLIDGLIKQITEYGLSMEELNALIDELNRIKQPNNQKSSENREER